MKKSRFTETQIAAILKEYEGGRTVLDLCREYGISKPTFFNWKSKYGGMEVSELKRLKELEAENARLKKMFADLSLDYQIVKEILSKKASGPANKKS
jgi:putative transposase